jgi:hypothetical protein
LLIALVAALWTGPAAADVPIWDRANDCVNDAAIAPSAGFHVTQRAGDAFAIVARPADDRLADIVDRGLGPRYHDVWNRERALLGGLPPGAVPYRIVLVGRNEMDPEADGWTGPYCNDFQHSVILVDHAARAWELLSILVHEGFHAFQDVPLGTLQPASWWKEATAAWVETQFLPLSLISETPARDERFLQRPNLPLPVFSPDESTKTDHEYGAFRFVSFLQDLLGETTFRTVLRRSFAVTGANAQDPSGIRGALAALNRKLEPTLGAFWGARLRPDATPAIRGGQDDVPVGDRSFEHGVDPLAAAVVRLRPDPSVGRITLFVPALPGHTYLWVQQGRAVDDWTAAGDRTVTYCVRGRAQAGQRAWPGALGFAFTNGAAGPQTLQLRTAASSEACGPPRPGACPVPSGSYDTGQTEFETEDPQLRTVGRIYFVVSCVRSTGQSLVNDFGGAVSCPAGSNSPAPLGPSGAGTLLRRPLDRSGSFSTGYDYGGAHIQVQMTVSAHQASGMLTWTGPPSRPCRVLVRGFLAGRQPLSASAAATVGRRERSIASGTTPYRITAAVEVARARRGARPLLLLRVRCWSPLLVDRCRGTLRTTIGSGRGVTEVGPSARFAINAGRAVWVRLPVGRRAAPRLSQRRSRVVVIARVRNSFGARGQVRNAVPIRR